MVIESNDLSIYGKYFSVVVADTPMLMHDVYRLRYQVYCIEHGFERLEDHVSGLESDPYDRHSVHAALIHRQTGRVCGCVRMILPTTVSCLPIYELVREPRSRSALCRLPRLTTAEVSRYAISKVFRRRSDETEYPDVYCSILNPSERRRLLPHITLGLMLAVATLSCRHGITHLAGVMSPALIRVLRNCGMSFTPLGPVVEHHGSRQPCVAAVDDLLDDIRRKNPGYFDFIRSGLLSHSQCSSLASQVSALTCPAQ
jgi:N-acyl amino acid synthase of PEP-CTERM/exosortase system